MPITAKRTEDQLILQLYGDIGFSDVTASDLGRLLMKHDDVENVMVRLNSYGGDVFEGVAIYERLKEFSAAVLVHVDGVAASAASVIAMGGNEVIMAETAMMMIHRAWTFTMGHAADLRKTANLLDDIDQQAVLIYSQRSGQSPETVREAVNEETWYTAEDAVEFGLADRVTSDDGDAAEQANDLYASSKIAAKFQHTPKCLKVPKANSRAQFLVDRMAMKLQVGKRRLQA